MKRSLAKKSVQRRMSNYANRVEHTKRTFHIYTMPQFMDSITIRDFTNKLKTWEECACFEYVLITKIFPTIRKYYQPIFSGNTDYKYQHCHKIHADKNPKRVRLISKICQEIYHFNVIKDSDDELTLWEIGFTRSIRIFGLYSSTDKIFYPLFCDWYHLIFQGQSPLHKKKDEKNNKCKLQHFKKYI